MTITEILGDSIQQDLNFVASKINDAPKNSTVVFIGQENVEVAKVRSVEKFSLAEIDVKNEKRYKFVIPGRKDLKVFFTNLKNFLLDDDTDFLIILMMDEKFDLDFRKFLEISKKVKEKIFLLTVTRKEPDLIKKIRMDFRKDLKLIQLGVPEKWIDF